MSHKNTNDSNDGFEDSDIDTLGTRPQQLDADLEARMILGMNAARDAKKFAADGLPSRIPALNMPRTGYVGMRPGKEKGDHTMNYAYGGAGTGDKSADDILAGLATARKVVLWAGQGVIASRDVAASASHSVRAWVDYAGVSDQSDAYSGGPDRESIVGMDEARRVLSFIAMGVAPSQEKTSAAARHIERAIESMTAMLDTEKLAFRSAPRQR